MNLEQFLPTYHVRAPNLMWFLGAGASASAGIPTAYDLIWDFKRKLYCASQKISVRTIDDLGNPLIKKRLQQHFDSTNTFPAENAEDEYSCYFEALHHTEADRRKYLDTLVASAVPSYGHLALAALLKVDKARSVWTTNFDRVIEDSLAKVFGTTVRCVTATLDTPKVALEALNEGRWPLLVKLHGDFQSRRLKNIPAELKEQDTELRHALIEGCKRFGIVVVGYSGRDNSIMDALEEAIAGGRGFPNGIFWMQRTGSSCSSRVGQFIERATKAGIEAHIIYVETFDELMADVINLLPSLPDDLAQTLGNHGRRVTDAPFLTGTGTWPLIRLNAVPITASPSTCRRVLCDIGGYREVREAIASSGAKVVAARRKTGVLAFGADEEVRKAFGSFRIQEFDIHSIDQRKLAYESTELGLLYEALAAAMSRTLPVVVKRKGRRYMLTVNPADAKNRRYDKLLATTKALTGTVPGTTVKWSQALRIKIEYRLHSLWLLIEPTIATDVSDETPDEDYYAAIEYVRSRRAERFNGIWSGIFDAWLSILFGDDTEAEFRTFAVSDGVDATFKISRTSGYSPRARGK